jgi:hypothetical protein
MPRSGVRASPMPTLILCPTTSSRKQQSVRTALRDILEVTRLNKLNLAREFKDICTQLDSEHKTLMVRDKHKVLVPDK